MNLIEIWQWMDLLSTLAFSSSETLEDRIDYARWWIDLAEEVTADMDLDARAGG